jgi:hypothetical protein
VDGQQQQAAQAGDDVATGATTTAAAAQGISLRAFAKLVNRNPMVISRAVKSGRIPPAAVTRDAHGDPKISDVALAMKTFAENTDLTSASDAVKERLGSAPTVAPAPAKAQAATRAPGSGASTGDGAARHEPPRPPASAAAVIAEDDSSPDYSTLTLAEASAQEKRWKAKTAELDYRERAGELVSAADVATRTGNLFTLCRTRLLGVPSKAKALLPHLTLQDIARLEDLLRESLEELASGGAGSASAAPG